MNCAPTRDHHYRIQSFNEKLECLLGNFSKEINQPDVLNLNSFQELVNHLNPLAELPKISNEYLGQPQSQSQIPTALSQTMKGYMAKTQSSLTRTEEVVVSNRDDQPTSSRASTTSVSSTLTPSVSMTSQKGLSNLAPCVICQAQIGTHHVLLTINDALKYLLAAVLGGPMPKEEAEKRILMHPLRMCTDHVNEVHEWMCAATGAKNITEVDWAPSHTLSDGLQLYRRLKSIRDTHDGKTLVNTTPGSFKLVLKTYFRNYVPRKPSSQKRKFASQPVANVQDFVKRTSINIPLRDYFRKQNVVLSPEDEQKLMKSLNIPNGNLDDLQVSNDSLTSCPGENPRLVVKSARPSPPVPTQVSTITDDPQQPQLEDSTKEMSSVQNLDPVVSDNAKSLDPNQSGDDHKKQVAQAEELAPPDNGQECPEPVH